MARSPSLVAPAHQEGSKGGTRFNQARQQPKGEEMKQGSEHRCQLHLGPNKNLALVGFCPQNPPFLLQTETGRPGKEQIRSLRCWDS